MLIEEDCIIALERALLGKTLCAFGEDGLGQHGRSDSPHYYDVVDVNVHIDADDDDSPTIVSGGLIVTLLGYDSNVTGHIMTDGNFDISLGDALEAAGLSRQCLAWAPLSAQGRSSVVFHIDVGELLEW